MGRAPFNPQRWSLDSEATIHEAVACASSLGLMTSRTSRDLRHFDAESEERIKMTCGVDRTESEMAV